jgi:hypothetical protein
MEHVVFFPGPDAAPAFRRFSSLDEAVRFVEHLRNAEGVSEVSVHLLTPVPVAFRPYYKVEVPADAAPALPEQPMPADAFVAPAPVEPAEMPVAEMPVAEVSVAEVPAAEMPMADVPMADVPLADEAPVEVAAEMPELAEMADVVPSANGKRSLGFFAH